MTTLLAYGFRRMLVVSLVCSEKWFTVRGTSLLDLQRKFEFPFLHVFKFSAHILRKYWHQKFCYWHYHSLNHYCLHGPLALWLWLASLYSPTRVPLVPRDPQRCEEMFLSALIPLPLFPHCIYQEVGDPFFTWHDSMGWSVENVWLYTFQNPSYFSEDEPIHHLWTKFLGFLSFSLMMGYLPTGS